MDVVIGKPDHEKPSAYFVLVGQGYSTIVYKSAFGSAQKMPELIVAGLESPVEGPIRIINIGFDTAQLASLEQRLGNMGRPIHEIKEYTHLSDYIAKNRVSSEDQNTLRTMERLAKRHQN